MFIINLQIKADIETKGEFINGLIDKVLVAAYTDIEDVLKFVDWLDFQLSSLVNLYLSLFPFLCKSMERASFRTKNSGCGGPYHVIQSRRFSSYCS